MKLKIGIFGSLEGSPDQVVEKARELGRVLAHSDVILLTGAGSGIPYETVSAAKKERETEIWGFSPGRNYEEQVALYPKLDSTIYSKLFYVPKDFPIDEIRVRRKLRNVLSTAECDAGIILSGRWGSLNEFTNLFDMGKVIGVLTGTGGAADLLPDLSNAIHKKTDAKVIFESSPKILVEKIFSEIETRRSV